METVLNPSGRIGPVAFRNAAISLIAIGALFSLLPLVHMAALSFASFLLFYPWLVIWVKRFHDAGKSGKMFIAVLVAWMIAGVAVNRLIVARFLPPPPPVDPRFIWASMQAQLEAGALPNMVVGALISLAFVLIINEELKSDPNENAYGPPPAR